MRVQIADSEKFNPVIGNIVLRGIQKQYLIDSGSHAGEITFNSAETSAKQAVVRVAKAFEDAIRAMSPEEFDWFEFSCHCADWKENRPRSSRADVMATHISYLRILTMGRDRAVPCILKQLRFELRMGKPDHWFPALRILTMANPVTDSDRGNLTKMAEAWIRWGIREGIIHDDQRLERLVPQPRA